VTLSELWAAITPWMQVLSVVGAIVQCLGVWALWSLTKKFVTREDCTACREKLEARIKTQEDSAGELHHAVAQAAPKEALASVDKADETLKGEIKALVATIQGLKDQQYGLSRQVGLLMQHHLGGNR